MDLSPYSGRSENFDDPNYKVIRERGIMWIENPESGAGKSEFIRCPLVGQKELICRQLPIDSVDKLL